VTATVEQVKNRLIDLAAEFKFGSDRPTREVARERMTWLGHGVALDMSIPSLERFSDVSQATIRRINPRTGEVAWAR
jgi:hypothetical protein